MGEFVNANKGSAPVVVFSKNYCPYCQNAIKALKSINQDFKLIELTKEKDCDKIQDALLKITGGRSVPRVFINGEFYGGGDETAAGCKNGSFQKKIKNLRFALEQGSASILSFTFYFKY